MRQSDAVEYFLDDMEHHGRNQRTVEAYQRVLASFEQFLGAESDRSPLDAGYRDCMAYIHRLRTEYEDSTVASYASYLNRFYGYLVRVGQHDQNPMELVLEEMNESIESNPVRRDISIVDMRRFLETVRHPLHRAIVTTLLKTGIRSGELTNLDLRDVHLDHEAMHWDPRVDIANKPDSLYIPAEHEFGRESGGVVREASNKRKRDTTVPIDAELKDALIRWVAIRPDCPGSSAPFFTGTADRWGERLTIDMVHYIVEEYAADVGWYRVGGGPSENVTPHYFRHFFTTHLRDRTGDRGVVKYLRGDVADDIIETYTHDWNDRVREIYLANIYSLTPGDALSGEFEPA